MYWRKKNDNSLLLHLWTDSWLFLFLEVSAVPSAADGSDRNLCTVCIRLIQIHGTAEYVSSEFCNCKSESERETEIELKKGRQTVFGVYCGKGFGIPPYLREKAVSPAAVEQPGCEHFGPLFRDHSE